MNTFQKIKRNNPYLNDDILFKSSNSNEQSIYGMMTYSFNFKLKKEKTIQTIMKAPQKKEIIKLDEMNENNEFQNMNCPKSKDIRNYFKKK